MSSPISPYAIGSSNACPLPNVGAQERVACTMGGAGLLVGSLFQHGFKRAFMLVVGGALLHRGVTGRCHLYDHLGIDTRDREEEFLESSESEYLGGS